MSNIKDLTKDISANDYVAFIAGQADCRDGVKHESGKGEYYDRGYATQYELEQVKGNG